MRHFIILGGGISGLVTAHTAASTGFGVTLVENATRLGGWIQTIRHSDGTHFELGPRTISAVTDTGKKALQYAESIGLSDKVIGISKNDPAANKRLIVYDHKLHEVQMGMRNFLFGGSLIKRPLILSILRDLFVGAPEISDDSFYNFFERRFGKELADKLVDPICKGITGGDSRKISVKLIMKKLFDYEQNYGSVTSGVLRNIRVKDEGFTTPLLMHAKEQKWQMWTLEGGLQTLIDKLVEDISEMGVKVDYVKEYKVHLTPKEVVLEFPTSTVTAHHLISAIPSHELLRILGKTTLSPMVTSLSRLHTVNIGLVNLEYHQDVLPVDGFGYLIASTEPTDVLGVTFDTCAVPMGNTTILTAMINGKNFNPTTTEDELLELAKNELSIRLGIKDQPNKHKVSFLEKCIPQYHVGYYDTINDFRNFIADAKLPLSVTGASFNGISVADLISSSQTQFSSICKTIN